jgi:hypothetical protein
MKRLFFLVSAVLCFAGLAHAGPTRGATTDASYTDWGNHTRLIAVSPSTTTVKLISSSATAAGLGINEWRYRRIVNKGHGSVMLTWDPNDYAVYVATKGIILAVDGTWDDYGTDAIYGVWIGTNALTGGAAGVEKYYRVP